MAMIMSFVIVKLSYMMLDNLTKVQIEFKFNLHLIYNLHLTCDLPPDCDRNELSREWW